MRLTTQMALLVGGAASIMLVSGMIGLYGLYQTKEGLRTVYEDRTVPAAQLSDLNGLMLRNMRLLGDAALANDAAFAERSAAAVEANIAAISKTWEAYLATYLTPEEAGLARQFAEHRKHFVQQGLRPAIDELRKGEAAAAARIILQEMPALFDPADRDLDALIKLQIEVAKQEYMAAEARFASTRNLAIAAILLGVLVTAVVGGRLARNLLLALGAEPEAVRGVADAVAAGDLSTSIVLRNDDQQSVMASMARMRDNLVKIVRDVRSNADGVAAASGQIAAGNADLSSRTEQQAGALQETAASMEELGTTVRHNAENAAQANQFAVQASSVATRGGEVVTQVVTTMKEIQDASRRIADIIVVIDGIAFQTNILALNAAVEAARAGEQGRGFAVVASEVRNLAQRSATAAREIKALITGSVDRVEQGSVLADRAGQTMHEVVDAIRRVADIMGEISSASNEQSSGVMQVGQAVTQMDQVTQQNAALVEQSAAAAESLKVQACKLVQVVSVFHLAKA
ncbi:MAG: methyl-accepting chemotaxis protein [Lautropia sp.]